MSWAITSPCLLSYLFLGKGGALGGVGRVYCGHWVEVAAGRVGAMRLDEQALQRIANPGAREVIGLLVGALEERSATIAGLREKAGLLKKGVSNHGRA